jgi:hypothetical protein
MVVPVPPRHETEATSRFPGAVGAAQAGRIEPRPLADADCTLAIPAHAGPAAKPKSKVASVARRLGLLRMNPRPAPFSAEWEQQFRSPAVQARAQQGAIRVSDEGEIRAGRVHKGPGFGID